MHPHLKCINFPKNKTVQSRNKIQQHCKWIGPLILIGFKRAQTSAHWGKGAKQDKYGKLNLALCNTLFMNFLSRDSWQDFLQNLPLTINCTYRHSPKVWTIPGQLWDVRSYLNKENKAKFKSLKKKFKQFIFFSYGLKFILPYIASKLLGH